MAQALRIRKVRRYRRPRYPSLHPATRWAAQSGVRTLLTVAVPAAAAGLSAEGCVTAGGAMLPGDLHSRYLTEVEARALIIEEVGAFVGTPADPCAAPTLTERLRENEPYLVAAEAGGHGAVAAEIDVLAPAVEVAAAGTCPGGLRPAVGFEFVGGELPDGSIAPDDEVATGNPNGLTTSESEALGQLRAAAEAAVVTLSASLYYYEEPNADTPDAVISLTAEMARERLRTRVRALLEQLRGEGFI